MNKYKFDSERRPTIRPANRLRIFSCDFHHHHHRTPAKPSNISITISCVTPSLHLLKNTFVPLKELKMKLSDHSNGPDSHETSHEHWYHHT